MLAYPQADIETELFMEVPKGFEFQQSCKTHCLRLIKNLYGQKQAGRVWNKHLHKGLTSMGFVRSKIDECVYYRGSTIFLCYIDDLILIAPDPREIDKVFQEFKTLKYNVTDEGQIDNYLGVKVELLPDGAIKLTQPHLIDQVLKDLNLLQSNQEGSKYSPKVCDTPAQSTTILQRDPEGPAHEESWSYCSVIGKLNFLEKSSRPDLAYSVHNCARFSSAPKVAHSKAVKRIGRYLAGTRNKGIIMTPDPTRSVEVHADADFSGLYDPETAIFDPVTAKSRTGYLVSYMGCPIIWASKLQTETAISTTEAEYNSCSEALRNVIPILDILNEAKDLGLDIGPPKAKIYCKLFCDNSGACELIQLPKMRPRTKHINTRLHHFREHVVKGIVTIEQISTEDQLADIATKPLPLQLFLKFRHLIQGW
jgi:histone deacetylase 1/2